jgi:hypothetical protein
MTGKYENQFRAMIYDAQNAINKFEDMLDQESVTRDEFLAAIRSLDWAGVLAEELEVTEV